MACIGRCSRFVFPKCNREFGTVYRRACVIGVYFELIGVILLAGVGVHCHPCSAIPLALQRLKIKYLILLILRVASDQSMTNWKAVQPLSTVSLWPVAFQGRIPEKFQTVDNGTLYRFLPTAVLG